MLKIKSIKSSERKTTCYIQGNPHNTSSRFFHRNFAGQKGTATHTHTHTHTHTEKKEIFLIKNTLPGLVIQN